MQASNNLTQTMQYFGKLTETERLLFLNVVSKPEVITQKKTQKRKKKTLPYEHTEDGFYENLVKGHNAKAKKLKGKLNLKV